MPTMNLSTGTFMQNLPTGTIDNLQAILPMTIGMPSSPQTIQASILQHAQYLQNQGQMISGSYTLLGNLYGSGYGSIGLVGANNASTPNTQYDFSADLVELRATGTNSVTVRVNTGTITNNVSTSGPAVNGRDQSGAFSASSWIHFYFIWNGTTLATLSSTVAPPNSPTLPSGYTHWCYLGAIYFDGSSHLASTKLRGNSVFYNAEQLLVSGGNATGTTLVNTSAIVPPNAVTLFGKNTALFTHTAPGTDIAYDIQVASGTNYFDGHLITQVNGVQVRADSAFLAPNNSQTLYYLWGTNVGTRLLYLICAGYSVPNNGM